MTPARPGRCRLGLRLGLFAAILAGLSCLNPRPDDQPLVINGSDSDGSGSPPATIDRGDGLSEGGSDNPGATPNLPNEAPAQPGSSVPVDADAGAAPPDAGPVDEPDAGATGD